MLIFASMYLEGLAIGLGAVKEQGTNKGDIYFEDITEGAENAGNAVDELKGKLLGFDKFRALSSPSDTKTEVIDKSILEALGGISSYTEDIEEIKLEARKLAESWAKDFGFSIDETNGKLKISESHLAEIKEGINEGKKFQTLLGVTGSGKTFTMANIIAKTRKANTRIST
jgi:hypothetical protein